MYTDEDTGKAFNFFICVVVFFKHFAGSLDEALARAENGKSVLPGFTVLPSSNPGDVKK